MHYHEKLLVVWEPGYEIIRMTLTRVPSKDKSLQKSLDSLNRKWKLGLQMPEEGAKVAKASLRNGQDMTVQVSLSSATIAINK